MDSEEVSIINSSEDSGFLGDDAKRFFAVAILLLMDLDIQCRGSSIARRDHRAEYARSIQEFAIGRDFANVIEGYCPKIHLLLEELGGRVVDIGDIVAIETEMALLNPWIKSNVYPKEVDESARRMAMKVVAASLPISDADEWVDAILDTYVSIAADSLKAVERKPKKWMYTAAGAAIGGFVFAPHVGAAIGSAMGLSGAAGTSAGLALLGGGSVASGGLGMMGGTYLVAAASSVVGAGAGAIATNMSNSNMSMKHEALKLKITIQSLRRFEQEPLVDHIRNALRRRMEDLAGQKVDLYSESPVSKWKVKEIEKEETLLLAVVPRVIPSVELKNDEPQ